MTHLSPGMWVKIGYRHCECCAAARKPAPYMVRITSGVDRLAAEHVTELGGLVEDLVEANTHEIDEHQLDHRAQARGGRSDAAPTKADSVIGVSMTRSPNLPHRPLVTPRTPPQASNSAVRTAAAGDVLPH